MLYKGGKIDNFAFQAFSMCVLLMLGNDIDNILKIDNNLIAYLYVLYSIYTYTNLQTQGDPMVFLMP